MKTAQLVVLAVALAAGGVAAFLDAGPSAPPAPPVAPPRPMETVEIVVAKNDIALGQVVSADDIQWQVWPLVAAAPSFTRRSEQPNAIQQFAGAVARGPFVIGEPIREAKLIKANGSGFMAAILPAGMPAISTDISPETGAGGFILPNDHVDVILTGHDREAEKSSGTEVHTSETLLGNVRVLAIDQTIEEKNGQRVVVGKTATLALQPRQAETLALARQLGTLSLALRSLADDNDQTVEGGHDDDNAANRRLNMVRVGVTTSAITK
jgi:pilus assembly protein CpaB